MVEFKWKKKKSFRLFREIIKKYDHLINSKCSSQKKTIMITGDFPFDYLTESDLCTIQIDGRPYKTYSNVVQENIALISYSFPKLKRKNKNRAIELNKIIAKSKELDLPFRLWKVPEDEILWKKLLDVGVGIISLDDLERYRRFYLDYSMMKK